MSAKKTISEGDYKRLKKLLGVAHSELASLRRTEDMIKEFFPLTTEREAHVNGAVFDHNASARELLRRLGVSVGRKRA